MNDTTDSKYVPRFSPATLKFAITRLHSIMQAHAETLVEMSRVCAGNSKTNHAQPIDRRRLKQPNAARQLQDYWAKIHRSLAEGRLLVVEMLAGDRWVPGRALISLAEERKYGKAVSP